MAFKHNLINSLHRLSFRGHVFKRGEAGIQKNSLKPSKEVNLKKKLAEPILGPISSFLIIKNSISSDVSQILLLFI